jgi:signal peptidase I
MILVFSLSVVACAALAGGVVARRTLVVATIEGPSMTPTYQTGDRVLVRRCRSGALRRYQVVLVERLRSGQDSPTRAVTARRLGDRRWSIKRIAALPGDPMPVAVRPVTGGAASVPKAHLVILGDGTDSHDSRQTGFVPDRRVLGIVIARLPRSGR